MPIAGLTTLIVPSILIVLLLLGLGWTLDRKTAFYRAQVDGERASNRFHAIDGLRGFLAVLVMLHHGVINYYYYSTGQWTTPPPRIGTLFGQGAVAMFFMVTALLFWHRALASEGRLDLQRFFWSRITRMLPMYLVASLALILTALALTHFRLQVSASELAKEAVSWMLFTFPGTPDINGLANSWLINTVFWTLVFEWKFYLVFPLLLFFASRTRSVILLGASAAMLHWYSVSKVEWYFLYGALAALILHALPATRKYLGGTIASFVIVGLMFVIYRKAATAYDPHAAPLFGLMFLIMAGGNSFFGLLTSRPARVLGLMSYSFYLTHNFVLYLVFRAINHFHDVASLPINVYWAAMVVVAIVTTALSALTYRYVEYPFLSRPLRRKIQSA